MVFTWPVKPIYLDYAAAYNRLSPYDVLLVWCDLVSLGDWQESLCSDLDFKTVS